MGSCHSGQGPVGESCEHGNKPSPSIKGGTFDSCVLLTVNTSPCSLHGKNFSYTSLFSTGLRNMLPPNRRFCAVLLRGQKTPGFDYKDRKFIVGCLNLVELKLKGSGPRYGNGV